MMVKGFKRIRRFGMAKPVLQASQSTWAVFAMIRSGEFRRHVQLGILYVHGVGWVGRGVFQVCVVLWIKTQHVKLLYLSELLDMLEKDCLALYN
jgi:hypothetical protein